MPSVLRKKGFVLILCLALLSACDRNGGADNTGEHPTAQLPLACTPDNGGLRLPPGFCAGIVADSLGFIRHLAVAGSGDIYVTLRNTRLNLGGIMALRDTDLDGRMDRIEKFSEIPGMGIAIAGGHLYFASDTDIYRYDLDAAVLVPSGPPHIIVRDLPSQVLHGGKPFALDGAGNLYVNAGSMTNACEPDQSGQTGSPGQDPCPELQQHAGIWRFSVDTLNQTQAEGYRYASGIRNAYAIDWHPAYGQLYAVQHGRDQLHEMWPHIYNEENGARLPAEEFLLITDQGEYSWPYCYYDPVQEKYILAPEYGGDGKTTGRCEKYLPPLMAFPAHYGPNDLKFYTAQQFPAHYHHGAFIAFHGSYNRGPQDQAGFQVVFVPFRDGRPSAGWEIFADGFAGTEQVAVPEDADYRPTGLALGPDGSLYIADSVQGRIWRVLFTGIGHVR